jgi:hypothetical protein
VTPLEKGEKGILEYYNRLNHPAYVLGQKDFHDVLDQMIDRQDKAYFLEDVYDKKYDLIVEFCIGNNLDAAKGRQQLEQVQKIEPVVFIEESAIESPTKNVLFVVEEEMTESKGDRPPPPVAKA